jgi:putative membrane protein
MFDKISDKSAVRSILALSAGIVTFLVWFIYGRQTSGDSSLAFVETLPLVNASLNGLSATFVLIGIYFISGRKKKAHATCMILATFSSALFLISCSTIIITGTPSFPGKGLSVRFTSLY